MARVLLTGRRSTLGLFGIGLGLSALAYLGGYQTAIWRATMPARSEPRGQTNYLNEPILQDDPHASERRLSAAMSGSDERWERYSKAPRTPVSERRMAAYLEELAAHDPKRAMALALSEGNFRLRQHLRGAVLQAWAAFAPDEAAASALALPDGDRQLAIEAVFVGAARNPGQAVQLNARLCAQEPALAGDYGQFLVTGLTEAGAYDTAVRFAAAEKSGNRSTWLNAAFFQWACHQPDQALAAFGKISDPAMRNSAFQGLILGWAMVNPAAVAAYADRLAPGEDRLQALTQALPQWASHDPVGASEWMINHFEPSPDSDTGVAAVATMPTLVNERPDVAVGWAESIAEPALRANTLRLVAQLWAKRDADAIRRFIIATPDLLASDRNALLDGLKPPPDM
jgi:hypothetical protein